MAFPHSPCKAAVNGTAAALGIYAGRTVAQSRDGRRAPGETSESMSIARVGGGGVTGTQYIQASALEDQVTLRRRSGSHRRSGADGARGGCRLRRAE